MYLNNTYHATYTEINILTGERSRIEEQFSNFTDAEEFLKQARNQQPDSDWVNTDFFIAGID